MAQTQNAGAVVAAGHLSGKVLTGVQFDFGADVSGKLAVGSTIDVVMKAIGNEGLTPLAIGAVDNTGGTGQGLRVLFEGEFVRKSFHQKRHFRGLFTPENAGR